MLRLRKLLPHARNPNEDVIMVERDGILFRMGAKYVCIPGDPSKMVRHLCCRCCWPHPSDTRVRAAIEQTPAVGGTAGEATEQAAVNDCET